MKEAKQQKASIEAYSYALDLEVWIKLLGSDFELRFAHVIASAVERIVQTFAAELDPQLAAIKLGVTGQAKEGTLRLRPLINSEVLSKGATASLIATALWSSVVGLKACVEMDVNTLGGYKPLLAGLLKREYLEIEKHLRMRQAVVVECVIKESWEYTQGSRKRIRSDEWRIESGQIRRPDDKQPVSAEPQPLVATSQIPLHWPFRPLSFFGPGDPFMPWWERRERLVGRESEQNRGENKQA